MEEARHWLGELARGRIDTDFDHTTTKKQKASLKAKPANGQRGIKTKKKSGTLTSFRLEPLSRRPLVLF
jgi:hypothetical protein